MYLAELELQGFKSFAQKTQITFGSGVTAIVGPNGCGKSNIVDALRWALGEQRPSLLRSSAMSNVIFNGTASKKPLGMAEVSVTIHNNKGILPTEFRDVTITRRLFRNGDSDYLLNKVSCRLKDIVDLFMDTGMGSNAYSVIELKMVEEILTDRNNDRRRLFEEAAGLTKYKERRKQTLRKLEETKTDLQRVDDLLLEIRKNVRSLQIQAGKAQRSKEYSEQLRKLDLALSKHEYDTIRAELSPLMERIIHAEQEKNEHTHTTEKLEQLFTVTKETLTAKEQDVIHAQRQVNRIADGIRDAETTITIDAGKIEAEENVIKQFEHDVVQSEEEMTDWKRVQFRTEEQMKDAEASWKATRDTLSQSSEVLERSKTDVARIRENLESVSKSYTDANIAISALQAKKIRLESRVENLQEEVQRLDRQIEMRDSDVGTFETEESSIQFAIKTATQAKDIAEEKRESAVIERQRLSERQEELKDKLRATRSKLDAASAEVTLLEGLARNSDAFPESVKYLATADKAPKLRPVSEILSTTTSHAVALESVLGDAVHLLVADTLSDAKAAFGLLRAAGKGKAGILPLDRLSAILPPHPQSLYHHVRCDAAFEPVKRLLLGRVVVADSLDEATKLVSGERLSAVTLDGDVIESEFLYRGGSNHKNVGLRVGLKDKLETLADAIDRHETEIRNLSLELDDIRLKSERLNVESLTQNVKEADHRLRELENKHNSLQARKGVYEKNVLEIKDRRTKASDQIAAAKQELSAHEPETQVLQDRLDAAIRRQVELRTELERKEEARQRAQHVVNEHQMASTQAENAFENLKKDIERAQVAMAGIKKRLDMRAQNARDSKDRILSLKKQVVELTDSVAKLKAEKIDADASLEEADEIAARHRGKLNQIETDLREVRRRKEVNMELVHHLTMSKERYDLQAKNISDHVWEQYGLLMEAVVDTMPEDSEPGTIRETISNLRERLKNIGEVNALAIDEFEEEKTRLDVFEKQIADLAEAEQKLLVTIDEINQTATDLFTTTFDQVRINFKKVFNTLFEEHDICDLVLDDSIDDPLEQKIQIIANPRGKRPSNIEQLSGGEKTLTAIALLFAIYLVKPSPFCILDEVDAPLDDANVERFSSMIKTFSTDTQFIIITHNKKTMENSEMLYGVTMPEVGVSKLVAVKMD